MVYHAKLLLHVTRHSLGRAGRTGEHVQQKYTSNHMNVSVMLVCSSVQPQLVVLCGAHLMIHYQM